MLREGYVLHDTYKVERLIGSGAVAAVYEVSHTRLPRRFALKILGHVPTDSEVLCRLRQEAEILCQIDHPNVIGVFDCNHHEDRYSYLVLELLDGRTLAAHVAAHGALSHTEAFAIFQQLAEGLDAAHEAGVIHCDLKPANIFLCRGSSERSVVKILDFGVAKLMRPEASLQTQPSALLGTPAYMAPEQARGRSCVDARTDQFALALILYEMLSGRAAFWCPGQSMPDTLHRVLTAEPEPLGVPGLDAALRRALAKQPSERFPTLREFVEAVRASQSEAPARKEEQEEPLRPQEQQLPAAGKKASVPPPSSESLAAGQSRERERGDTLQLGAILLIALFCFAGAVAYKSFQHRSKHAAAAVPSPPLVTASVLPPSAAPQPVAPQTSEPPIRAESAEVSIPPPPALETREPLLPSLGHAPVQAPEVPAKREPPRRKPEALAAPRTAGHPEPLKGAAARPAGREPEAKVSGLADPLIPELQRCLRELGIPRSYPGRKLTLLSLGGLRYQSGPLNPVQVRRLDNCLEKLAVAGSDSERYVHIVIGSL